MHASSMQLTVAICTKDRCGELEATLQSIAQQTVDEADRRATEILIIDNGSADATQSVIDKAKLELPFETRGFIENQPGLSFARNRALEEARGNVIAFIDDDVNCVSDWLNTLHSGFQDPGLDAYGGPIIPVLPVATPEWLLQSIEDELGGPTSRYWLGAHDLALGEDNSLPLPFGANMGVRAKLALAIGGFATELGWGKRAIPGEDTDFFTRLRTQQASIRYLAGARVEHRISASRTTLSYYRSWQEGYGRFEALRYRGRKRTVKASRFLEWSFRALTTSPSRLTPSPSPDQLRRLRRHMRALGRIKQMAGL